MRKKPGPKPKGVVGVMVKMEPDLLAALDAWIEAQPTELSRPAAIRSIVARRLKVPLHQER